MSQATVVIDTKDVEKTLLKLDTALSPPAIATFLGGVAAPWLNARAKARFGAEGDDAVGGKWLPLAPETERIRAWGTQHGLWAVGPDHPINVRTHALEQYIVGNLGYTIPTPEGSTLVYPNDQGMNADILKKLTMAQKGGNRGMTPKRPVLGVNERDMDYILHRLMFTISDAMA